MSTDTQIKEVLSRALSIITNPDNWTKEAYARNENDEMVLPENPKAVKYCLLGAIRKSAEELYPTEYSLITTNAEVEITKVLTKHMHNPTSVGCFNDHEETTHEDVIYVIQTAIEEN